MSDQNEVESQLIEMLIEDNKRLKKAGSNLAMRALHVISEYDGLHRLALAVSEWTKAVADEGGRSTKDEIPESFIQAMKECEEGKFLNLDDVLNERIPYIDKRNKIC